MPSWRNHNHWNLARYNRNVRYHFQSKRKYFSRNFFSFCIISISIIIANLKEQQSTYLKLHIVNICFYIWSSTDMWKPQIVYDYSKLNSAQCDINNISLHFLRYLAMNFYYKLWGLWKTNCEYIYKYQKNEDGLYKSKIII